MRVAVFTPYLPLPAEAGGRIRMTRLAAALRRRGTVTLFAGAGPRQVRAVGRAAIEAAYDGFIYGRRPFVLDRLDDRPRRVALGDTARLRRSFVHAHAAEPFDVALVEHSYGGAIPLGTDLPMVLDEHNIESRYYEEVALSRGQPPREVPRYRAWEEQMWTHSERVVAVSEQEAAEIRRRCPTASVDVVENGVDLDRVNFRPPSARRGAKVLFVGLMSHRPNVKAAMRLAKDILPLVWKERPDAELVLCGAAPAPEVRDLAGARVTVTGTVASVGPFLDAATVMVNPLEHGAGTSLKVAEALASGAPLVSTSIGVRGYPDEVQACCDLADSDEELARTIIGRLTSPAPDRRAQKARELVSVWDWAHLSERFADIVAATARRGTV